MASLLERAPLVLAAAQFAVAERRVVVSLPPAPGFVTQAQRSLRVLERAQSQELPGEFPLAQAQSLLRECWILLWLLAAQLAAREQR